MELRLYLYLKPRVIDPGNQLIQGTFQEFHIRRTSVVHNSQSLPKDHGHWKPDPNYNITGSLISVIFFLLARDTSFPFYLRVNTMNGSEYCRYSGSETSKGVWKSTGPTQGSQNENIRSCITFYNVLFYLNPTVTYSVTSDIKSRSELCTFWNI